MNIYIYIYMCIYTSAAHIQYGNISPGIHPTPFHPMPWLPLEGLDVRGHGVGRGESLTGIFTC